MEKRFKKHYLDEVKAELEKEFPENRTVNIVCHGHSVPAGYAATPEVDTFSAYPFLLHERLKKQYPNAVINVIVTGIGGETSVAGCERFEQDVLSHRPDVITIDYALNDRNVGMKAAQKAWRKMIEQALAADAKVILMTPSLDTSYNDMDEKWYALMNHAVQIRSLADEYRVGLCDSTKLFINYVEAKGKLDDLLSYVNHPSEKGHGLIAAELASWFDQGAAVQRHARHAIRLTQSAREKHTQNLM